MSFANWKVGTRLNIGFGVLLAFSLIIGGLSWVRLSQLDDIAVKATTEDWEKARLTMEMEIRTRDNAAKALRVLLAGNDADTIDALKSEMAENSAANDVALERLRELVKSEKATGLLEQAAEVRELYTESRGRVSDLARNPQTRDQALELYKTETAGLLEAYIEPFRELTRHQQERFEMSAAESAGTYRAARNTIIAASIAAALFGVALAILLARGIVRPLRHAVKVADAVKAGRLDNVIDASAEDETGQLLGSLDAMQGALRARDAVDADFRGQIAAIDRAQAVIEFGMDGRVQEVNENFARTMGYSRTEVIGRHHSMFVDPAYAASADYRAFWDKLNRGSPDIGNYKRVARGGREVWIQASYNPIPDASGKPFKVLEYASDVTAQMVRNADNEGQLAAISRAQAVIEFDMNGNVRAANEN